MWHGNRFRNNNFISIIDLCCFDDGGSGGRQITSKAVGYLKEKRETCTKTT